MSKGRSSFRALASWMVIVFCFAAAKSSTTPSATRISFCRDRARASQAHRWSSYATLGDLPASGASCVYAALRGDPDLRMPMPVEGDDPWQPGDIVSPESLAKIVASKTEPHPVVLQVGIAILFKNAHVPGSIYAGPAMSREGLEKLKAEAGRISRRREVIIYCGCCPWKDCPNIRPAYSALKAMGFKDVKVLSIPQSFPVDWVSKGYPVESGK